MNSNKIHEGTLLDETIIYTLTEIASLSNIEEKMIIEMVEYGIAEPIEGKKDWVFNSHALLRFKKAIRLHQDLKINWAGISLALYLIEERDELLALLKLQK